MPAASHLTAAERLELLQRTSPFCAFDEERLRAIATVSRTMVLKKGERVWSRGVRALHLGVVIAGRLKISTGEGRREVILDVASPGDVLGEVAFSMNREYQTDVVCLRRARVLLVPCSAIRSVLQASPQAALALAMDLAEQNVRMQRAMEDLSAGSVEQRLARVLLRLADRVGEPFPGGTLIPMRLRRSDLAAIAATTLESASRRISDWHRRGWVVPQPAGYLLRDLVALRAVVDRG